jgi:hypothetical protein
MAMLLADAVGWVGAACLLLGYAFVSSGRLTVGFRYHLLNLAGALGLAINGVAHGAWPSTALNLIWLGIGLGALRGARREVPDRDRGQDRGSDDRGSDAVDVKAGGDGSAGGG